MKRKKLSIKQRIVKKIEFNNKQLVFIDEEKKIDMNERDKLRLYGIKGKPGASTIDVKNLSNSERTNLRAEESKKKTFEISSYLRKAFVDYDIVICIPSHERYEKIKRMINQFYSQQTKYTFKIILLNDGSTDIRYDTLVIDFPEIIYIKNETPNGIGGHWRIHNQLLEQLKTILCHGVLIMDDDFILCNEFLNKIVDTFFIEKENDNSILAIAPHSWSFKQIDNEISFEKHIIDGIGLFDIEFIKALNYQLDPIYFRTVNIANSAGVWGQISNTIKNNNCCVYRTPKSLVWHDGNDDSKMHGEFRKKKAIYTQNFIEGEVKL